MQGVQLLHPAGCSDGSAQSDVHGARTQLELDPTLEEDDDLGQDASSPQLGPIGRVTPFVERGHAPSESAVPDVRDGGYVGGELYRSPLYL